MIILLPFDINYKNGRLDVFCNKAVLRNFAKFTTCARVSFLRKLQLLGLQLYLKRESGTGVFL